MEQHCRALEKVYYTIYYYPTDRDCFYRRPRSKI